jgi:aspartate dehydrogenase
MAEQRIALIGFGAIGRDVAARLQAGTRDPVRLAVLTRSGMDAQSGLQPLANVAELLAFRPHLVIEAAGHAAVSTHVVPVLQAGIPVVLASVGALADETLHARLRAAAEQSGADLILPGGAIGGIDYIKTVAQLPGLVVRYCSRKPVAAWTKELAARGLDPQVIASEVTLFEGSARDAALSFPQNLNVAMTLALAGAGMDATKVRVVADPRARGNTHEIDIESEAGRARFVFENTPSTLNPKTSALTALSIVHAVRDYFAHRPHSTGV